MKYILIFLGMFWSLSSHGQQKDTLKEHSVWIDFVQDVEYPAFNKELLLEIQGDTVAGYAFLAKSLTPKETVILISGYPGNDNNFDLAQAIRRGGKNVVHFNHRGAWGSQGKYYYSSCLEDVSELIAYLNQEEVAESLRIAPNQFILLGRSYGGGIALITGSQNEAVKKIIAISSTNYGEIMKRYTNLEDLQGFKRYMKKQVMINTNIDVFLQELLDKQETFNVLTYQEDLKHKQVLIIEDSSKNQDWIKQIEHAESVLLESDHNFIDKRIQLTNLIVDWIGAN